MKLPTDVSESTRKRNPALYGAASPEPIPAQPTISIVTATITKSTDESKLNKTETQYLAFLRCLGFQWIGVQSITLKLADDTRYTPDFWVVDNQGHVQAREVKGFFRDDAKVKIKVAARMFPWVEFQLVRKTDSGWEHSTVKP